MSPYEIMTTHKLCYQCKDFFIKKYGASYYTHPATHCHHPEPEERPNFCSLKNPRAECVDFEMKAARGWCKDCLRWRG